MLIFNIKQHESTHILRKIEINKNTSLQNISINIFFLDQNIINKNQQKTTKINILVAFLFANHKNQQKSTNPNKNNTLTFSCDDRRSKKNKSTTFIVRNQQK